MKIKKKLIASLTALVISATAPKAATAFGSSELMIGDKSSTIDLKVTQQITPQLNVFLRNRTTDDYASDKISHFGVAELNYDLGKGFSAMAEAQFISGIAIDTRLGLSYFFKKEDFAFYSHITANDDQNYEGVANITYKSSIKSGINGVIKSDTTTNWSGNHHNFSIKRLRTGLDFGKCELGLAADINQSIGETKINIGAYAQTKF